MPYYGGVRGGAVWVDRVCRRVGRSSNSCASPNGMDWRCSPQYPVVERGLTQATDQRPQILAVPFSAKR
jgi:hypothetical protein